MAKKSTPTKNLDLDVAKELEQALDLDLSGDEGGLDMAASMDDLEAQISQAAEELAREGRKQKAAAPKAEPAPVARAAEPPTQLRPVETRPLQPEGFKPANDDRAKDYKSLLHSLNRRASSTIYWMVGLVSVAWVAGAVALADRIVTPSIWTIRSFDDALARPGLLMLLVATIVPIALFWAFAAMIRRAQEMRIAAQSMTEVAFRLAEPENMAQDRVMMVGQAVRREVAAMGEGIERTLARAVELETLVHTPKSTRSSAPIPRTPPASVRSSMVSAASARPSSPTRSASAPRSPAPMRRCATNSARPATSSVTAS
jgi:hypothetical protein